MTRLHFVKKARKANKKAGIKKGASYWWWAFRRTGKRYSLTKPPRSAYATQNEHIGALMDAEDEFGAIDASDREAAAETVREIAERVGEVKSEVEERVLNVEQAFPNGCPSLDTLRERLESCEALHDALDSLVSELEDNRDWKEEDVRSALDAISWEYN